MARYNFLRKFLITIACVCVLPPVTVTATDNSTTNTQDSASQSSTGDAINNEVTSHHYNGIYITDAEYGLSSTSDPKARCRTSSLTQEEFLEMVKAIALHGDLKDRVFIEKTLQVKFVPADKRWIKGWAKNYVPDGEIYSADIPDGLPHALRVILYIGIKSTDKGGKPQIGDRLTFKDVNKVGAVFHNCQYLTKKQFNHKFDDAFPDGFEKDAGVLDLGKVGKSGADIEINYLFNVHADALEQVSISQQPEFIQNQ